MVTLTYFFIFNAILKIERNDSIKAVDYYGIVWKINSPNTRNV